MKKILILLSVSAIAFTACNNDGKTDSVDKADSINDANKNIIPVDAATSEFLVKAAAGGMMEVDLGSLAQQKATSSDVKDFGSMMVADHSDANSKIKILAAARNVTLPSALSDDHKKMLDDLNAKKGKDFDKAYIDMMVNDHKEDISEFEKASNDIKDADVKAFVDNTLPVLRKHLDAAQAVQKKL